MTESQLHCVGEAQEKGMSMSSVRKCSRVYLEVAAKCTNRTSSNNNLF